MTTNKYHGTYQISRGSFINYVDKIFDQTTLPLCVAIFYGM